jgi:hypothetical protein
MSLSSFKKLNNIPKINAYLFKNKKKVHQRYDLLFLLYLTKQLNYLFENNKSLLPVFFKI